MYSKLFNQMYYFFLLSAVFITVVNCDQESDMRDRDVCKRACIDDFFSILYTYIGDKQRNNDAFGELKPFWSTCQYRCYRCRIPGANDAMDTIEWKFTREKQRIPGAFVQLVTLLTQVEYSLTNCVNKWAYLNRNNDQITTIDHR
jgi:hypothetical protein